MLLARRSRLVSAGLCKKQVELSRRLGVALDEPPQQTTRLVLKIIAQAHICPVAVRSTCTDDEALTRRCSRYVQVSTLQWRTFDLPPHRPANAEVS